MPKITKKQLNEYISLSSKVDIDLIEENKNSYKIIIIGDKSKVRKNNFEQSMIEFVKEQKEFNNKQNEFNNFFLEFIKEQKEFNKKQIQFNEKIEKWLNYLESDVKLLKSFHKNEI